jgi:exopolysaccharide biosynthesis polyprenyl glycosylphosphotransferase
VRTTGEKDRGLKVTLVAADLVTLLFAWFPVLAIIGTPARQRSETLFVAPVVLAAALLVMRHQGLYLSRRCAMRSTEVHLVARSTAFTALALVVVDRIVFRSLGTGIALREIVVGSALMLPLLAIERAVFRTVLRRARQQGQRSRPVLIVGAGAQAARFVALLRDHADLGMTVAGVLGDAADAFDSGLQALHLGAIDEVERIADELRVTGIIITPTASEHPEMTAIVKRLQQRGLHVQIAHGLTGFDLQRLRQIHVSREPMIYLEQSVPGPFAHGLKRAVDLVVSATVLVVLLPVYAVISAAIRLDDGGPVVFAQTRVGLEGQLFRVYKFRTMVVGAESRLPSLQSDNERSGPLFKIERDPRVTRVGHILRLTSLDELPQFVNVLLGTMSVVGPRPALLSEVVAFDTDLRRRELVKPGITGLWQVEARDVASFDEYRRLDLFYVDNWTVAGDLQIMLDTAEHLFGRLIRSKQATAISSGAQPNVAPRATVAQVSSPVSVS